MFKATMVSASRILSTSTWLMMSLLCFGLAAWSPARAATPTLLATGFANITAIASDGTNIYFGTISGQLYRMTKTGTDLRNIANVPGFIGQILFQNGKIWFYGNPTNFGGGSIYAMPQDLSAAPTVLRSGVVKSMGITGSTLFYWDGDGGVKSIPISGGTPDPLLPPTYVSGFAVDGTSIFLQGGSLPGVSRLDTVTKAISSSIPQATASTTVFVDANNVYAGVPEISGLPDIYKAPKQGGTAVPLVNSALPAGQNRGGLLSDGDYVYYTEGPGGVGLTDTLKSIPVGGGTPTTLADGVSIRFMINVNGTLFWSTPAESGAAMYRLDVATIPADPQQPQTRPEFQGLHIIPSSVTVTTPLKRNAVVLVHGWNSSANVGDWPQVMAKHIRDSIDIRRPPNELWDVYVVDWTKDAALPLSFWTAYTNARVLGVQLAGTLAPQQYDLIHFIAHSAGSNLIENAALRVKLLSPAGHRPVIHSTFLDAYDPNGNSATYGFSATSAEHYVDKRFLVDLPNTGLKLPGAYNFDITALDFDATGINSIEAHKWPYRWYQKTVEDVQYSIAGFRNAPETGKGALLSNVLFPKGDECNMASGFTLCLSSIRPTIPVIQSAPIANPFNIWVNPGLVTAKQSPTGVVSLTTPQVIGLTNNSPVWVSLTANIPQGFNTLELDYRFTAQAEGLLSVFIDNDVMFKADQRQAVAGSNPSGRIATGNITPGPHTLSFRLDHFTPALSAVMVSNIRTSNISITREVNLKPVANAGKKQKVRLGSLVYLDASASFDPDKKPLPLTYEWKQSSGPSVLLFGPSTVRPKFTPIIKGHYEFSLVVNDGQSNSNISAVKVHASKNGDLDEEN